MSTILVEARKDVNVRPALELIAQTCRELGHDVFRWRGPISGRVPYWRWTFRCDLAILFNGTHRQYAPVLRRLKKQGSRLLLAELGWHPQKGTIQIDPAGINARASWAQEPLAVVGRSPLPPGHGDDLLVLLQLDGDTQVTELSPWFKDMRSFVKHLLRHSALPVRVRPHPLALPSAEFVREVEALGGQWDKAASLTDALSTCAAVACLNSSGGLEALSRRLPVLCYGLANYRHAGAVYCLGIQGKETRLATAEIASGRTSLWEERAAALALRIQSHQWPVDEIPRRLPSLLASLLPATGNNSIAAGWLTRLVRDFPERVARLRAA